MLIRLSILLAILLLISCGTGYYFSDVILLENNAKNYGKNPEKQKAIEAFSSLRKEIKNERIQIKSPLGYNLIGYYLPAEKPTNKTIITLHGYMGSKDDQAKYAKMFHSIGYNVIAYDQRNHGESSGTYTTYGILESKDLQAVVQYAKKRSHNGQIGIHGVSMGAATTLIYAGNVKNGADFFIADCPYSNFLEESKFRLKNDYTYIPSILQGPIVFLGDAFLKLRKDYSIKDASPIDSIQNIKAPVLFINTKTDDYIPPQMTQDLYDKKKGPKSIYWTNSGKHGAAFDEDSSSYKEQVIKFLEQNKLLQ
ncbi:alpha/beta hydrolase [Bacillus sp. EAC]|uniref:alpha/beta hydrolase n=1 Tax=Bacillus sp. EAC TaxID=1978338 RepID=UPI000B43B1B4|nr:alpha/beta hydrolase [Bacillus sp. EAC]